MTTPGTIAVAGEPEHGNDGLVPTTRHHAPSRFGGGLETALAEYLSHAPVFVRRVDGEIIYWTRGAEELYGFTADQAVGRN